MFKNTLKLLSYILISFVFLASFTQWSESYIYWYTWREDYFNFWEDLFFYVVPFLAYLFMRYNIKFYKLILIVDLIFLWTLSYYFTEFYRGFLHLSISIMNIRITYLFFLYLGIWLYFLCDFLYLGCSLIKNHLKRKQST